MAVRGRPSTVGQCLFLAHGRLGKHLGGRLLGIATEANASDDVVDPTDRFDIRVRLVDRTGEQQPCPTDDQVLAIFAVATVGQAEFTASIHVVADVHMPEQVGRQTKAFERQFVLPHVHIDVHGDAMGGAPSSV